MSEKQLSEPWILTKRTRLTIEKGYLPMHQVSQATGMSKDASIQVCEENHIDLYRPPKIIEPLDKSAKRRYRSYDVMIDTNGLRMYLEALRTPQGRRRFMPAEVDAMLAQLDAPGKRRAPSTKKKPRTVHAPIRDETALEVAVVAASDATPAAAEAAVLATAAAAAVAATHAEQQVDHEEANSNRVRSSSNNSSDIGGRKRERESDGEAESEENAKSVGLMSFLQTRLRELEKEKDQWMRKAVRQEMQLEKLQEQPK